MVAGTRLIVTLYLHFLSCYFLAHFFHNGYTWLPQTYFFPGIDNYLLLCYTLGGPFCRVLTMVYVNWTNIQDTSFTRNEVTETSGRLHPLGPQNKWLHTPRTTNYRHTRQDRRVQTEMAFTLAKNAIKPNPFEIVLPLQTTRKENNWKTEEALARAAVTLETERIKGTNPWCLWWWWLWWWPFLVHVFNCRKIVSGDRIGPILHGTS